jgi:hypothetical protein
MVGAEHGALQLERGAVGEEHAADLPAEALAAGLANESDALQHLGLVAGRNRFCGAVYISQKLHLFHEQPSVTGRISESASLGGR